jgi:hypothetical protein
MSNNPTFCDKHQGGIYSECLACRYIQLSSALSRISYTCAEPNEMHLSEYDIHCNEDMVVEQVLRLQAKCEALIEAGKAAVNAMEDLRIWGSVDLHHVPALKAMKAALEKKP